MGTLLTSRTAILAVLCLLGSRNAVVPPPRGLPQLSLFTSSKSFHKVKCLFSKYSRYSEHFQPTLPSLSHFIISVLLDTFDPDDDMD